MKYSLSPAILLLVAFICLLKPNHTEASFRIKPNAVGYGTRDQPASAYKLDSAMRQLYAAQHFQKPNENHYRRFKRVIRAQVRRMNAFGGFLVPPSRRYEPYDEELRKVFHQQHFKRDDELHYLKFRYITQRAIQRMTGQFGSSSLAFGILALTLMPYAIFPGFVFANLLYAVTAAVFGLVSIASPNQRKKGLGAAGLALGMVAMFLSLLLVLF